MGRPICYLIFNSSNVFMAQLIVFMAWAINEVRRQWTKNQSCQFAQDCSASICHQVCENLSQIPSIEPRVDNLQLECDDSHCGHCAKIVASSICVWAITKHVVLIIEKGELEHEYSFLILTVIGVSWVISIIFFNNRQKSVLLKSVQEFFRQIRPVYLVNRKERGNQSLDLAEKNFFE